MTSVNDDRPKELETLLKPGGPWTPSELIRIAELTESVHGDDAARQWWVQAAATGNQDAQDYLMELILENESF